jgi:ketosteroid isomerase-like protein
LGCGQERRGYVLAKTPSEAVALADEAFNRGDIEGMLAFYEDQAILLFEPGRSVRGRIALRSVFEGLLPLRPIAKHDATHVIESGDIALWTSKWSVSGISPDGTPIHRTGCNSVVFRRGVDGGWRVAVENPWGALVLEASSDS